MTPLTFGHRKLDAVREGMTIRRPHKLAIIYTCRRIYLELGKKWLSKALLHFESLEAMLDKLTSLPPHLSMADIRYIRVRGDGLRCFDKTIISKGKVFFVGGVMRLFTGLRLEELTVIASYDSSDLLRTLGELVARGSGWKRLRCVCDGPLLFLAKFKLSCVEMQRFWAQVLAERDGVDSGASVRIYSDRGVDRVLVQPDELFDPDVEPNGDFIVVVTRGCGADYQVRSDAPPCEGDLRAGLGERSWGEARPIRTIWQH
jgi:hypothetical protein